MKYVGAHVSAAGGIGNAPLNAARIGAKAFALFTRNQRQWTAKPLNPEDIAAFRHHCRMKGFAPERILAHDSYLPNLGHPEKKALERSRAALLDEMSRCEALGIRYLNLHPGSHLQRSSEQACLTRIAESIRTALEGTGEVVAVIENTAGQGSNLGFRFDQIARIVEQVHDLKRVGVCLDTAHAFAAGYDIRAAETLGATLEEFDRILGFDCLCGVHLNDSRTALDSRVDRHASIGKGLIGLETFRLIMNDSRFDGIPLILETPESELWAEEIRLLYGLEERR